MGKFSVLWREVKSQRPMFLLLVGIFVGSAATTVGQAYALASLINGAFLEGQNISELKGWLGLLLASILCKTLFIWAGDYWSHTLAAVVKADVRKRLVQHVFEVGPVGAARWHTGEVLSTLMDGVENLEQYFSRYLPQLVTVALIPPLILAVIFIENAAAGVILIITGPLVPAFMVLIGRWAGSVEQKQWQAVSRLGSHFFDVLAGLTTLILFNRSKEQSLIIARMSESLRKSTLAVLRVAFLSSLTLELLTTLSTALVAVIIGLKLLYGQLAFREAFFILLLTPNYFLPLRLLGSSFHAARSGQAAAQSIQKLLAVEQAGVSWQGERHETGAAVEIGLEKVTFRYADEKSPVLNEVSFTIHPKEKVALVGESGAGKSTIADMLLGFIAPDQGCITVNGRQLYTYSREGWLSQVAYVPQFPHIFHGSVADNIRFGRDGSWEEVRAAAKAASADEFIEKLPQGYATVIGEGGLGLSGGESQRIAIARAFYKKAPFLILDEPASGLDAANEYRVSQALENLMADRTVLIIAHRLSTVYKSDRIVVLENGRVTETGTHKALLANRGSYYRLISAYKGDA
ncbi:MAG: transporter, CydDC cysteine exporter (CydDC-E) family, permease/ATP-binding protein CydD [Firmicutes bacterium]|nr:transporter, CydDC cysteine exporter (CydDC-E) family, permease/ATP-binding protein CydD [Bacillota bacterium]